MSEPIMKVTNLKTYYKTRSGERVCAVDGVSYELREGAVLGIAGESGCGKSTVAASSMGSYYPPLNYDSGSIQIGDQDVTSMPYKERRLQILGTKIAYIPQSAMNALNPTARVSSFIFDIMREHEPGVKRDAVLKMAEERFEHLGLPARVLNAYPNELSGGMKQRTVIAISTILNPDILIADEPTSALDVTSQKSVISMLRGMMNRGEVKAMIFITHELPLLRHVATDIAIMYAGEFVELGTSQQVIFDPIHPYSHALMKSIIVPEEGMKNQKLAAIPGAPPNLKNVPPGCRFAERCPQATPQCKDVARVENLESRDGRTYRCIFDQDTLKELYMEARRPDRSEHSGELLEGGVIHG